MAGRVLVTGASIAGNTLAARLAHHGFDVTVVERADAFRDGGQNIDVRGVGREVLRRMGLEDAALAAGTGERGTVWIDAQGRPQASFVTDATTGDGPTAEMEILRGDLARLLYDVARERAEYRFGDHVVGVEQDAGGVAVRFAGGTTERYDAVVVAEGVGSSTRELVFAGENDPRWMHLTMAYFTIPRTTDDDRMWRWYNAPGKRSVSLRPDRHGTTRAMLSLWHHAEGEERWDRDRQRAWLRARFAGAGWQTPRVLDGMDAADDYYFDSLRQVRMKHWSAGRVALTGDAAWCVTPLGGVGATLAVTGGYLLAEEMARADDPAAAFAAYERALRPMVTEGQGIPKIGPRIMHPDSRLGIRVLHSVLNLASKPAVRAPFTRLFGGPGKEPDLSGYA